MATSIPPLTPPPTTTTATTTISSSSSSNKENANHTRLCRLLVDIGRQVLQDVFDRIYPPSTLNAVLWSTSNQKILKNLKTKKILFGKQWGTLFPKSGAVTSADLDITLLFLLLRNICKLKAPGTGWDKPPLISDLDIGADLVRIKICRNELAHIVNAAIPDNEFQTLWDDIEAALLRLGGSSFQVQIQRVKHGALDEESELSFYVLTQCWEEGEKMTVDAIREMHGTLIKREEKTALAVREGSAETVGAIHELKEKIDQEMISINGTIKKLTAAGLVVTWAAGSGYFLHRYRNDPEKVIQLVNGAIIPSLFATVACVRDILPGSFKILVEIQSLEALDAIWKSYIKGDMKKNLEKVIVTDDLRCLAPEDVIKVDISLEISEDDYKKIGDYLLECVLRNYWKACKIPSTTSEETSAITRQVQNIGICVKDPYEYKAISISFKPGKIEWKVLKELLTKATKLPDVRKNKITLEISNPIDEIAHALVETSADLNLEDSQGEITLLIYSTKMGADKAVEILVNASADVNVTDEVRPPLMYAVETGSLEVVEILMKAGDSILTDTTGKISLIHAAQAGMKRVAQSLIEAGAGVKFTDAMYAVDTGSLEFVDILIKAGVDVTVTDARQKTPLMYAVETGNTEVVDILIKAGAEVNLTDLTGKTSLIHAAQAGKTRAAQCLIEAGAEVNVTDARQKTPLMYAVETGNPEVVDILIKAGAEASLTDLTGKTSLIHAAQAGKTRITSADVVNVTDARGKTPLIYAVETGCLEVVDILIKAGADVNMTDTRGKVPLMYAVETGSIEVVDILMKAGAEANLTDVTGKTSLIHAAQARKTRVAQCLIEAGAEVNVSDVRQKTPLMYAAETGNPEVVDILIKAGADVNMTDARGKTSLLLAAVARKIKIVHSLVNADANVNVRNEKGKAALMYMIEAGNKELVDVMVKAGADVNMTDARGKAPLIYAVETGSIQVVDILMKAGADVKLTDAEGKSALLHAVEAGQAEIVQALVKAGAAVNVRDTEGKTALMHVSKPEKLFQHSDVYDARKWRTKMVETLIEVGADVKLTDAEGKTALIHAVSADNIEIVQVLVKADADVNVRDTEGMTALMYAVKTFSANHQDMYRRKLVEVLLQAGADVNISDAEGKTALMHAVKAYTDFNQVLWYELWTTPVHIEIVEALLKAGANVNVIDTEGRTALIYAVKTEFAHHRDMYQQRHAHPTRTGDTELVEVLLQAGADVNMSDAEGQTALMYASKSARHSDMYDVRDWVTNVVEILVKAGAVVKLKDAEGKTALIHAVESGNTDVEEVLRFADVGGYAAYGQSAAKGFKTGFLTDRQEYLYPMRISLRSKGSKAAYVQSAAKGSKTGFFTDRREYLRTSLRSKGLKQKREPTSSGLEFDPDIGQIRMKTTHQLEKARHFVDTAKEFEFDPFTNTLLRDEELKESELTSYGEKDLHQVKLAKRKQNPKKSRESRP